MTAATLLAALGLTLLPCFAAGATFDVDVGSEGLSFTPDTITASVGDIINFHFYPSDHSVAQSNFDNPCNPSGDDAIFSGFISPSSGEASTMFSMPVNTTDTIWLYCSAPHHCQSGMAMVVNPGSDQTLDEYKSAAQDASSSSPANVFGGIVEPNVDGAGAASTSAAAASTQTAAATTESAAASTAAATTAAATTESAAATTADSSTIAESTAAASSTFATSATAASTSASSTHTGAASRGQVPMLGLGLVALPMVSWMLSA